MDVRRALAALSESTRFRIVELLDEGPRTVGEVAATLGARQPATTKHLQALEAAGLVVVNPLGRRRVVALRRDTMRELAAWLDARAEQLPDESVLWQYRVRVEAEERRSTEMEEGEVRRFRFRRALHGTLSHVWSAWTEERVMRRWWAPDHFEVADCSVRPEVGGEMRIVLREGDGAEYVASGEFVKVDPPSWLVFVLSPLGPDGEPLFRSRHEVTLRPGSGTVALEMTIEADDIRAEAAPALAGIEIGWNQQLDRLAALLEADSA